MCISKANQKFQEKVLYNLLIALYNEIEDSQSMLTLYEELVSFTRKKDIGFSSQEFMENLRKNQNN